MTLPEAAERAGLDRQRYLALEGGSVDRTTDSANLMLTTARAFGLEEIRVAYVDEVMQYMKLDLSSDAPPTIFVDTLQLDVRELKDQAVFVSPSHLLALFDRVGPRETLSSREAVAKQLIELWVTAIFTLSLQDGRDYYIRLVKDDPPDAEVLAIDATAGTLSLMMVEVTRHGNYSKDLHEVIRKKLNKRYQEGTMLVVLVEQAEKVPVADLVEFVRQNNPYNQRICLLGSAAAPEATRSCL